MIKLKIMAEFQPDRKLSNLATRFVEHARQLQPTDDAAQIRATFTRYMLSTHPGMNISLAIAEMNRRYRYDRLSFDGSTALLTIDDGSGERTVPYLDSSRILFEDLISRPELLRSYDELLVLVRAKNYKQGIGKIRTMRHRIRKIIEDNEHEDGTWDLIQVVQGKGMLLMRRDLFLESGYHIG